MTWPAIGDYALIGNCRTAALVSRSGSIEWLCAPTFSSPSLFGAILDRGAGHFSVRPRAPFRTERRYVDDSNVLETTFRVEGGGVLRLTDCMPLPAEPTGEIESAQELEPEHEVLRRVECLEGEVELEVEFAPRPDYARQRVSFARRGKLGWQLTGCRFSALLHSEIGLSCHDGRLVGSARLRAGEARALSFTYDQCDAGIVLPLGDWARRRMEDTVGWWQWWSGRSTYQGEYRGLVLRSGLVLKLLNCATSGAVLAAPTTSLPEAVGGKRNWDYRYCWLRDSALVLHAFLALGFLEEAQEFLGWLLHATRLTWPQLQVMYDIYGETRLGEKSLPHLCGYRGSRPVRIGNAAHEQLQLDIYGELVAAVAQYVEAGGELDSSERRMLAGLAGSVCRLWRQPDQGIWESRGQPRHHTYSKAMCWVALDRLAKLRLVKDAGAVARERDAIRADIEQHGFSSARNSYVAYYGGEAPDASLLLLARHGYRAPQDGRMRGTFEWVTRELARNGFLLRYEARERYDGLQGGENAFAACSFWAAEYLANLGRLEEARELFERLAGCANDVGLYAEELLPATGEPVGNFPQAFSHVSLVSAAVALSVHKTA